MKISLCSISAFLLTAVAVLDFAAAAEDSSDDNGGTIPWDDLASELSDENVLKQIGSMESIFTDCAESISTYGGAQLPFIANGTCIFAGVCVFEDCVNPMTDTPTGTNVPSYSVIAESLEDVQTAIKFASDHNVTISVKSTGASYSVADQLNGNLLIMMSSYPKHSTGVVTSGTSITENGGITENYVDSCGTEHGPVIEMGGGETWGSVFNSVATYNEGVTNPDETKYILSSGAAVTVGSSGGWLMGGGLGPFDRSMGLGIDNVVAFQIVIPNGEVHTASECENEDLFWALRGGGGGNFGVVVSQITKLHVMKPLVRSNIMWLGAEVVKPILDQIPDGVTLSGDMVPDNLAKGSIGTRQNNIMWTKPPANSTPSLEEQLDMWYTTMLTVLNPATMDDNIDGYYGVNCAWGGGYMCADLYFQGTMEEFEEIVLSPLRNVLNMTALPNSTVSSTGTGAAGVGASFVYVAQEYDGGYYSYASQDCLSAEPGSPQEYICTDLGYPSANGYNTDVHVDQGGYETRLSWMVPDWFFGNGTATDDIGDLPSETVETAKALFSKPLMYGAAGHVLGGAVNTAAASDETSTSPVMRESALEVLFPLDWIQMVGMEESLGTLNEFLPAPKSGPIFNHDARNLDLLVPLGKEQDLDWQQLYWGTNLPKLREIKAKFDPTNVFRCRDCFTVDDGNSTTLEDDLAADEDDDESSGARRNGWFITILNVCTCVYIVGMTAILS